MNLIMLLYNQMIKKEIIELKKQIDVLKRIKLKKYNFSKFNFSIKKEHMIKKNNLKLQLTDKQISKMFQKWIDEGCENENSREEREFGEQRDQENKEKMRRVRACKKNYRGQVSIADCYKGVF